MGSVNEFVGTMHGPQSTIVQLEHIWKPPWATDGACGKAAEHIRLVELYLLSTEPEDACFAIVVLNALREKLQETVSDAFVTLSGPECIKLDLFNSASCKTSVFVLDLTQTACES
ncbi:hypothetical protein LTR91_014842 [Friedmanniomyces endolithicus]|uniref:Uncharacterized protein n=1 Tax=Friedmanniomyces endolithicus TaxID=329885 RepID=A0AAN6KAW3_9PEZI|nr:hypothetical protein LTR94_000435 [Friedmanniomyces endolithicus]KAK0788556.1 hypothetical protein LTR59_009946 [Friedmanniomyces endolithicus]KAK0802714.1 hypothetical protein LTR38_006410 [Friedmanniomyces endolithicus]KAK0808538.1 hypothetical protein LTR75_006245 [Friedmanniomyces endolithicus]KAK0856628.1 hypothetical protein LTS02_010532 [Friedmanniomyces endolithicus]